MAHASRQPPSGGCVLKPEIPELLEQKPKAAAFGRLCVETSVPILRWRINFAAAFGRLCVETLSIEYLKPYLEQPPSGGCVLKPCLLFRKNNRTFAAAFGRLCVETTLNGCSFGYISAAAFGRLCVETVVWYYHL